MNPSVSTVPIPPLMASRPVWHGLAVPFVVEFKEGELPDFKTTQEPLRMKCLVNGLCGLCGGKLHPRVICFIGGPMSVAERTFFDPPMHEECALYATKACPFLSKATHDYRDDLPSRRPDRMAVYYCRSYDMFAARDASGKRRFPDIELKGVPARTWYIKAGKPFKIDWNQCAKKPKQEDES